MTVRKSWKAEYWPEIIEQLEKETKNKKRDNAWPYIYDYTGRTKKHIEMRLPTTLTTHRNNHYVYVNSKEVMQVIVSDWHMFGEQTMRNFHRSMKSFENKYLLKAIYNKRKGEFDALVAENDN